MLEFVLKFAELGVVGGFDAEDGAAEDQELAHDGDGAVGDFTFGFHPEEAQSGDDNSCREAGNGDGALKFGEFLLGHGTLLDEKAFEEFEIVSVQGFLGKARGDGEFAVSDDGFDVAAAVGFDGGVVVDEHNGCLL